MTALFYCGDCDYAGPWDDLSIHSIAAHGACWFCSGHCLMDDERDWVLSWEWDARMHVSCLLAAALDSHHVSHDEAMVAMREFYASKGIPA